MYYVEMERTQHKAGEMTSKQIKKAIHNDWRIESIDDTEVIGLCEACRNPILEGEPHTPYIDSIIVCFECEPLKDVKHTKTTNTQ